MSRPVQTIDNTALPLGFAETTFMDLPMLSGTPVAFAEWLVSRSFMRGTTPIIVEHVNLNNCFLIRSDPELAHDLATSAVLIFDGIGMKIAALISGKGWMRDINGNDLFPIFAERAQAARSPIFFLGSSEDRVRRSAENTQILFPSIELVGYHSGYFSMEEEMSVVMKVNKSGARVLIVGLGVPLQDRFALRNRERFDVSVIWAVGGLFDFLSGAKPRAPRILRVLRLEWLFRFVLEPRRMWRRNMVIAPLFFMEVLKRAWNSKSINVI